MDVRVLQLALQEVSSELSATDREFEQLQLKKTRLETIQSNLSAFLNEGSKAVEQTPQQLPSVSETFALAETPPSVPTIPVWVHVRNLFAGMDGGTLTVPEIQRKLNAEGIVVENPDAIRIAMRRKPELFNNDGFGRYSMHGEDMKKEAIPEETTS